MVVCVCGVVLVLCGVSGVMLIGVFEWLIVLIDVSLVISGVLGIRNV